MTDYTTLYQQLDQLALLTEESGNMPAEEIRLLRNSGLLSIVLPGHELDFNHDHMPELLMLLKDVGRSNGAVGRIYEGHINTLFLIHLYANEEQRSYWYNEAEQHQKLFGVWNTDGATGISFAVDTNTVMIKGSKGFCSGSSLVDYALIGGKTNQPLADSDWQMVVVPMDQVEEDKIDRNSWRPMGMKASVSHTIDFSGIILGHDALLGKPGDYLRAPFFLSGAIRFAAVQLGMAEAVYNKTMTFLRSLNRLEDPFQKMRIGRMAMAIHSGQLWIQNSGNEFDRLKHVKEQHERLIAYAHLTRLTVESTCLEILELSAKCVGAKGLMAPGDLERWHRDLSYYLRQPAPDATLQNAAGYLIGSGSPIEHALMERKPIDNAAAEQLINKLQEKTINNAQEEPVHNDKKQMFSKLHEKTINNAQEEPVDNDKKQMFSKLQEKTINNAQENPFDHVQGQMINIAEKETVNNKVHS